MEFQDFDFRSKRYANATSFGGRIRRLVSDEYQKSHGLDSCDWAYFTSGSPVLEAWSRWNPAKTVHEEDAFKMVVRSKSVVNILRGYLRGDSVFIPKTINTLKEVLQAADMLLIPDLKEYSIDCMSELELDESNCFDILLTSTLYNFEHPDMHQFFRGHLTSLTKSAKALGLSIETLEYLLEDEELTYWPEKDKLTFIKKWCEAQEDHESKFVRLLELIHLDKVSSDFIRDEFMKEALVINSPPARTKIKKHLQEGTSTKIPIVLLGFQTKCGINLFGFSVENCTMFRFKAMHKLWTYHLSPKPLTVNAIGNIVFFENSYLYEYDVTTCVCTKKQVTYDGKVFNDARNILSGDRTFFVGEKYLPTSLPKSKRLKFHMGSTIFVVKKEHCKSVELEPLLSFRFVISSACLQQSKIYLTSSAYNDAGKVFCYDTRCCCFFDCFDLNDQKALPARQVIHQMIATEDRLLLVSQKSLKILHFPDASGKKAQIQHELPYSYGNPKYIFFSGKIIEVKRSDIRIIEVSAESMESNIAYNLKHISNTMAEFAMCSSLPRTIPFCHLMCPHCDPKAWENEEKRLEQERLEEERLEEERLEEERRQQMRRNTFTSNYYQNRYDYDREDFFSDEYFSDYDDGGGWSDKPEQIWDGSANEFVDAWW